MPARILRLVALAFCVATLSVHGRTPHLGEPLVATEAGFVLFGNDAVFFSADGRSFTKADKFSPANDFKAVPVRGGIVTIDKTGLRVFDAQGRFQSERDDREWLVDVATDGRNAAVLTASGAVYFWDGAKWERNLLEGYDGCSANLITFAFNRWWVCGSLPEGEEESRAAVWTSPDGRSWEHVELPAYPAGLADRSWPPDAFFRMIAIPGCLISVNPYGVGVATRDGRTWKWLYTGDADQSVSTQLTASLSRFLRVRSRGNTFLDQSVSLDAEKWLPLPANPDWETWTEIPSVTAPWLHAKPKAGGDAVIVDLATFRAPAAFLAQLAADRAAAALAARQRAEAEAAAKALAEQRAAEEKALAERLAAEEKAAAARQAAAAQALAAKQAERARLQPIVDALTKFDTAFARSKDVADTAKPIGELMTALDKLGPQPLADAVAEIGTDWILESGGNRGLFELSMNAPDARLASIMRRIPADQKAAIRTLATAHNQRLYKMPQDTAAVAQAISARPSYVFAADARGPQASAYVELDKVRQTIARGTIGALYDLAWAHNEGSSTTRHKSLGLFWTKVLTKLDPQLVPLLKQGDAYLARLAASGSPMVMADEAIRELERNGNRLNEPLLARLEQAAEGGSVAALATLEDEFATIALHREGSGMSFDAIYALQEQMKKASADAYAAAKASGLTDQQIADNTARAQTEVLGNLARDMSQMSKTDFQQASATVATALAERPTAPTTPPPANTSPRDPVSREPALRGHAAISTANARIDVDLKGRMRLHEAERGKAFTDAEVAEIKTYWESFASGRSPADDIERFIFLLQQLLRAQPGLATRDDIAPLVRQAHVRLFGFALPPASDPVALTAVAEESLADLAMRARALDPASFRPAIFRAAAERARFPILTPALSLPLGQRAWDFRHEVDQLLESADLMESWNGRSPPGEAPPYELPAALSAASAWPKWPALVEAVRTGDTADTIHWLNELSLSLRAESLRRQAGAPAALPPSLDALLLPAPQS